MAFEKIKTVSYPDQNCMLVEYKHDATGLRHFHLESQFPEMSFILGLPTAPVDDTGAPHILEHLTLCGSEKYPVKDPFMAMNNRSVAHDMNAFTSNQYTGYNFSTTVQSDFSNLSDLYLDLVFNPLLRHEDFKQEGWRLEQNSKNEWEVKGVVLNEMKGVYAQPARLDWESVMKYIAPDHSISLSSGGRPLAIPHLSYERLVEFHRNHYAPEKAVLGTAGDIDIASLHASLEDTLSRHVTNRNNRPVSDAIAIPEQAFDHITKRVGEGYVEFDIPGNDDSKPSLRWIYLKDKPSDALGELYDQMITESLLQSPSSPFVALEEKWQVSISVEYLYDGLAQVLDKVGLIIDVSDLDPMHRQELQQDIDHAWSMVKERGITSQEWDSGVAGFAKSIRGRYGVSPYSVLRDIVQCAVQDKDPLDNGNNLALLSDLSANRPSNEDIRNWCDGFLSNPLPVMTTRPVTDMNQKWVDKENAWLEQMVVNGTAEDLFSAQVHEEKGSIDLLPMLDEADLNVSVRPSAPSEQHCATLLRSAYTHVEADSENVLFRVVWDLGALDLSEEDLVAIKMWSMLSSSLGTDSKTQEQQALWDAQYGVDVGFSLKIENDRDGKVGAFFVAGGSSLYDNAPYILQSLQDHYSVAMMEESVWKTVFHQVQSSIQRSLSNPEYIMKQSFSVAAAPYSDGAALTQQFNDLFQNQQLEWLSKAIANPVWAQDQFRRVLPLLEKAPRHVISIGRAEHGLVEYGLSLAAWMKGPQWNDLSEWVAKDVTRPSPAAHKFPTGTMVNYCMQTHPGPAWDHDDALSVRVALQLLDPVLHELIREKGGAYSSQSNLKQATISFLSYRDPYHHETLEVFRQVPEYLNKLVQGKDDNRLREAKLSLMKGFMAPKSSWSQACYDMDAKLRNMNVNDEQWILDQLANVSWDSVAGVIDKWFRHAPENITTTAVINQSKVSTPSKMAA